jgi:hypothetical protein
MGNTPNNQVPRLPSNSTECKQIRKVLISYVKTDMDLNLNPNQDPQTELLRIAAVPGFLTLMASAVAQNCRVDDIEEKATQLHQEGLSAKEGLFASNVPAAVPAAPEVSTNVVSMKSG